MKKRTRSILDEINSISDQRDRRYIVENTADNVIASASNLIKLINETYDADTSADLTKRFINSIRTQDEMKFRRGIRKANESKRHTGK
jgi:hypothetical protein|tara:strand:- start:148 stop:411 length:264 start_codon:yes stop_codon:yes gene_type:complete